jgi:hypothetical protein
MPRCVDCAGYLASLNWCKAKQIRLDPKIVTADMPCADFKYMPQPQAKFVSKMNRKPEPKSEPTERLFFPYWLSRYILESIKQCGNMSLAYDLLLQDACLDLKRRLKMEGKTCQKKT